MSFMESVQAPLQVHGNLTDEAVQSIVAIRDNFAHAVKMGAYELAVGEARRTAITPLKSLRIERRHILHAIAELIERDPRALHRDTWAPAEEDDAQEESAGFLQEDVSLICGYKRSLQESLQGELLKHSYTNEISEIENILYDQGLPVVFDKLQPLVADDLEKLR